MILRDIRTARRVDPTDFSDLTTSVQTAPAYWHPDEVDALVIPMDPEPSESEAAAIRRRLVTVDAADEEHLANLLRDAADPNTPPWAQTLMRSELARYGE